MTDAAAAPPGPPFPASGGPRPLRVVYDYLSGHSLLARALLLALLTLALEIPLGLVGGVIADRQRYESEAAGNVADAWGRAQTFVGPMIVLPYRPASGNWTRALTLLPDRLSIDGKVMPQQRKRGLFSVTVYAASLDVVAEFSTKAVRDLLAEGEWIDWPATRLTLGLSEAKSIDVTPVDLDGKSVEWTADTPTALSSLQASLAAADLGGRESLSVRFRISFAGTDRISLVPLGRRTEASIASPWPSPSFFGRYLPAEQSISTEGFSARWAISSLGRGYGQLWDGAGKTDPPAQAVLHSAFGLSLFNPVNAYREADRAIKYGVLFIALTFAACLLFELATGRRPLVAQYGLIGLSLCIFYLLLLSFSEQIGFGLAYLASASAVVVQAALYTRSLHRRIAPALAFGGLLGVLYGALYALLQLEDVALLSGSLLLFAMLSLAMWFTRNLHRTQPA
ncbi:MAG TPA: cell envelope integrity protein CreD [Reyranella sp.]|nr:cell envelope integrity protein CreD [Reyranella sp.]